MALHARKKSEEQEARESAHRLRLIRADRITKNASALRRFKNAGLVGIWEYVHGKRMPDPNLEKEPLTFLEWLGVEPSDTPGGCPLEMAYAARREREEYRDKIRRIAFGRLSNLNATQRRRARLVLATPKWADRSAIRDVYAECRQRNADAGVIEFHVDHVIPLQGRLVTGLHVVGNLRIIGKQDNLKKRNTFLLT